MVLALARPSEAWCFPPGADFFEAVLLLAAAGNRICRKILFLWISDDTVLELVRPSILALARPSEAWRFLPGS